MKNLFFLLIVFIMAQGCSTLKPASSGSAYPQQSISPKPNQIKFVTGVSINPSETKLSPSINKNNSVFNYKPIVVNTYPSLIEGFSSLQFKYAIREDVPVEELGNEKLLSFIDDWYGTKYRFGGSVKGGIDCSAFSSTLLSNVFGVNDLPRMARDQYAATTRISKDELQEGDLVFFHTYNTIRVKKGRGRRHTKTISAPLVTHVGVYLRNNKFVHASVSGVMISDLGEGYYASHYVGAGRAIEPGLKDSAAN